MQINVSAASEHGMQALLFILLQGTACRYSNVRAVTGHFDKCTRQLTSSVALSDRAVVWVLFQGLFIYVHDTLI